MREVAVERVLRASRPIVERALSPAAVVEFEGSFDVRDVEESGDATVVTATGGRVMELAYRFEPAGDGYHYVSTREEGPFDHMETWLTVEEAREGTRVVARSEVSLGLPLPFSDRIAAWKRKGELRRLLSNLAAEVE